MFTRPTVFIVGAGASAEFGMPTGAALMKAVSEAISFRCDDLGVLPTRRIETHHVATSREDYRKQKSDPCASFISVHETAIGTNAKC